MKNFFKNLWLETTSEESKIYREWDRQRSIAMSPSEVAEIDAIFSRSI